jgi:acetyl esterase
MALAADAQELIGLIAQALPKGLHEMTIAEARTVLDQLAPPATEDVHAVHEHTVAGPAGDIPLRLYVPTDELELPVLVWLHGGAFAMGSLDGCDGLCRELANAAGAIVAAVDYRLAPEHRFPTGLEDCYAATSWISESARDVGCDPCRVAIGGDSAGATLAAAVCLMARDRSGPPLVHQLLVYPTGWLRLSNMEYANAPLIPASMCEHFWQLYVRTDADRLSPYCAPLNATDLSGLPSAFIVVPEVDGTRDDQELYARRLAEAGVATTCKRYPGSFHGFFPATAALATAREAMADAAASLRAAFAPKHPAG